MTIAQPKCFTKNRERSLPRLLHLRTRLPSQGHPDHGSPGRDRRRSLHRLRQLRAGVRRGAKKVVNTVPDVGSVAGYGGACAALGGAELRRRVLRSVRAAESQVLVGMLRKLGLLS